MQGPLLCTLKCATGMHQTMAWLRDARRHTFIRSSRGGMVGTYCSMRTVANWCEKCSGTLIIFPAFPPFIPMDLRSRK
jgi:hypothetical protein